MAKKHENESTSQPINNASPDLVDALRSIDAIGENDEPGADDAAEAAPTEATTAEASDEDHR